MTGPAIASHGGPDPILAAIEAHKAATAATRAILDVHTALELELPDEKCRSSVTAWEEEIFFTDDPRWIEAERAVMQCHDAEEDAAITLIDIRPTTRAGLMALLQYALAADVDGETWPRALLSDDGTKTRSWHYFLIENITAALTDLVTS